MIVLFNKIEDAVKDIKLGKFVIVLDNEDRENEGDLITSAKYITKEKINFLITHCKGLVCVPMCKERLDKLSLDMMIDSNCPNQAAFTVSVDHINSGTGISAESRALTIKKLACENSRSDDFIKPGHIFPLKANCNGVFKRSGHTEATIELMKLAQLPEVGVLCEILNEDGTTAKKKDLFEFAKKHNFKIINIEDLKLYLQRKQAVI